MWLLIILTAILIACVHFLIITPYGYWKKRGVPCPTPIPILGNVGQSLTFRKTLGDVLQEVYNEYKDYRYVGVYKLFRPYILIRDPELWKDVEVTSFSSFHDNDEIIDDTVDPIMAKNPFFQRGENWRIGRTQLSSNISVGKLRNMFYIIDNIGKSLVEYTKNNPEATGKDGIETKELAAKFSTDVVSACAFGLEGNSFTNPDAEFRKMGKKLMSPNFYNAFKFLMVTLCPSVLKWFNFKFFPEDVLNWFTEVLMKTVKYRIDNNITRHDFLDSLIGPKDKNGDVAASEIDIIGQAMTFYLDGFESSAIMLSFTLYEIGANSDVQIKLQEEIDKYNGEITYEAINEMRYLDNVMSESLRKYAAGIVLRKLCTKEHKFPPARIDGTGPSLDIPVGMGVFLPTQAIHHDPQYYPDPEKFDPDRFTEEAKETRPKNTYLPFGDGPRQCIGSRFALVQMKVAIAAIVANFDITVNPRTITPIVIDTSYFMPHAKGGLWLNYHQRSK